MPAPPGGSANINGVLYQLLAALDHMIVGVMGSDAESGEVRIIVEPPDGGDIQSHRADSIRVEQWKAKGNQGSWSLHSIISDVFPDLFLAVKESRFKKTADFVFMTEGKRGTWEEADKFFARCSGEVPEGDPRDTLDDKKPVKFFPKDEQAVTERGLFNQILTEVSKRDEVKRESPLLRARKLFFLLGRFKLQTAKTPAEMMADVDEMLSVWISARENVEPKRNEALGYLLGQLRNGPYETTAESFRAAIRLKGRELKSIKGWEYFCRVANSLAQSKSAHAGYRPNLEARSVPSADPLENVLVVTGESGRGKTWYLGALAHHEDNVPKIWVTSKQTVEGTLGNASWEISHRCLERDEVVHHDVAFGWLRLAHVGKPGFACRLFVDDVREWDQLNEIVSYRWTHFRFQLVVSTTAALATALQQRRSDIKIIPISTFGHKELRKFFERRDKNLLDVPKDVRPTLVQPVLAEIYCGITDKGAWVPQNEYDLFYEFWRRIEEREQAEHPFDRVRLCNLVVATLTDGLTYPWDIAVVAQFLKDDETRKRLEKIGWLRRAGSDRFEIWSDRLLNWAIAEGVSQVWGSRETNYEELLKLVVRHASLVRDLPLSGRLGFVAADLLWIQLKRKQSPISDILDFVLLLEGGKPQAFEISNLYQSVISTLGSLGLSLLVARLFKNEPDTSKPRKQVLADTFVALLRGNQQTIDRTWKELIDSTKELPTAVAEAGLAVLPSISCIDHLFQVHRANIKKGKWAEATVSYETVLKNLRGHPGIVRRELEKVASNAEYLGQLLGMICLLPLSEAHPIWIEKKLTWMAGENDKTRSGLISCTARFSDRHFIILLKQWAANRSLPDGQALHAFAAFARLEPHTAADMLGKFDVGSLWLRGKEVIRSLWLRAPTATKAKLLEMIRRSQGAELLHLADLYLPNISEVKGEVLKIFLEGFEYALVEANGNRDRLSAATNWAKKLLMLTAHPAALEELFAGGAAKTETVVTEFLQSVAQSYFSGSEFELTALFRILLRFGGPGLDQVLCAWLRCPAPLNNNWSSYSALFSNGTRELLRARAANSERELLPGGPLPLQQRQALVLLRSIDDNANVVENVMRLGPDAVTNDLVDVGLERKPMSDEDIKLALQEALQGSTAAARINAIAALGISGEKEIAQQLFQSLQGETNQDVQNAIVDALRNLSFKDRSAVPSLREMLRHEKTAASALLTLAAQESPEARSALAESLLAEEPLSKAHFPCDVRKLLLEDSRWRQKILEVIWQEKGADSVKWFWMGDPALRYLPELGDLKQTDVEQTLWDLAVDEKPFGHVVGQGTDAVRGISKVDPELASKIAQHKLETSYSDRAQWIELVVELNHISGVSSLLNQIVREKSQWMRHAIALAIFKASKPDKLESDLRRMLLSDSPAEVSAALEIASWQSDTTFQQLILEIEKNATEPTMIRKSQEAALRYSSQSICASIAEQMVVLTGRKQWIWAEAWGTSVEPLLVTRTWGWPKMTQALRRLPLVLRKKLGAEITSELKQREHESSSQDKLQSDP